MSASNKVIVNQAQNFNDTEKTQGRQNIEATKVISTSTALPPTSTSVDTLQVFTDGRVRGDNTDLGCIAPNVSQADAGKILVASWHGSPGVGAAQWQNMPDVTPWGVNTDTTVQFTNQPYDEYDDPNPAINVIGIQNFKNNIVDIALPPETQYKFCDNNRLRINPPTVSSPSETYGYNFWVRIAIHSATSTINGRQSFTVEIPNVGWELDQYWLQEDEHTYTFSTKRLKIIDNPSGTQNAPYILTDQQVGPDRYPEKSTLDTFSSPHQIAVNYREEWTANTASAIYDESLSTFTYGLHNNFESNTSYITVNCPSYGYTNYYMIKVSGDMAKLSRFQPPAV